MARRRREAKTNCARALETQPKKTSSHKRGKESKPVYVYI